MSAAPLRSAAVILAAGAGGRLGLGPKAHVALGNTTLLAHVVRSCRDAGVARVLVVGRGDDPKIEAACAALDAAFVCNHRPELGMWSSVQAGLRAATEEPGIDCVVVFPVDVPLVEGVTVARVVSAVKRPVDWARPVHAGAGGHPIAIGATLARRLATASEYGSLREALRLESTAPVEVACGDPAIALDVDTPADLVALQAVMARRES